MESEQDKKNTRMLPVRCFTCNKPIADKWEEYVSLTSGVEEGGKRSPPRLSSRDAMDRLCLVRVCCRTAIVTHAPMSDYDRFGYVDTVLDNVGTTMRREVKGERRVECE